MSQRTKSIVVGAALALAVSLTGCGVDSQAPQSGDEGSSVVRVITHDSWNAPDELIAQFEEDSGYTVEFQAGGDAGELTNKLILSKDAPTADVAYGIDNTLASRAISEGVFEPYLSADLADGADEHQLSGSDAETITPIDYGDVCINIDKVWFEQNGVTPPASLDDLLKPEYQDLFVTPSAVTSSPGMAFFLATVAKYGEDGWQEYWTGLLANGAKIVSGWTDAYSVDFSGGEGQGARPIVLSYASSPPFTIPEGGTEPTTAALLNTCFRQVEYAGVLDGAQNVEGAKAFIDFLSSQEFQSSIPDNMYMYPVDPGAPLPQLWADHAAVADEPLTLDPAKIADNRETWLKEWADVTSG